MGKYRRRTVLEIGGILMASAAAGGSAFAAPELSLPETLPPHPRLLARPQDWAALDQQRKTDPALEGLVTGMLERARVRLKDAPLERKLEGRRLLSVSRELVARVVLAAFAFRVTAERAFLERAEKDMLAVSAFSDWNPSHFLDVAEMTTGLAIGYDWLFDHLSPTTRATIRTAIVEKGLNPGSDPAKNNWYRTRNNWNQVCLAGMALDRLPSTRRNRGRRVVSCAMSPNTTRTGWNPTGPRSLPGRPQLLVVRHHLPDAADRGAANRAGHRGWSAAVAGTAVPPISCCTRRPSGRYYNFADGGDRGDVSPALFS